MALQLAIDEGLIKSSDDLVKDYWNGVGVLNYPLKYLDRGNHVGLQFNDLVVMRGGFPVTNGFFWNNQHAVPQWASWTGDPDFDNYAHVAPGVTHHYSSGGYWRLAQALTAIWGKDLKRVLDEKIMSKIGIPASQWDWLTGRDVRETVSFYPDQARYGGFLDPPYDVNGHPVRGGPGWAVMSALDFARLGLLMATGGKWKGEQLISRIEQGSEGVSANAVQGWGAVVGRDAYIAFGKVATGFQDPTLSELESWLIGPVKQVQVGWSWTQS